MNRKKRHKNFNNRMELVSVSLVEIIYSTEIFSEEKDQENSQEVLRSERVVSKSKMIGQRNEAVKKPKFD